MNFSEAMFAYHDAENAFSHAMVEAGFGSYRRLSGDWYDNSIEFYEVDNNARMGKEAQKVVFDAGFSSAYVNHSDGWETYYNWDHKSEFSPVVGWRRRWVVDPTSATTNIIGGAATPEDFGYYEISFWPESWKSSQSEKWLETGYMRIVPDPLASSE